MLRTGLCRTSVALPRLGGARLLHQLPPMPVAIAEGCEPFLSKRTTNLLWTQWQAGLLQRLNEEVKGACRLLTQARHMRRNRLSRR